MESGLLPGSWQVIGQTGGMSYRLEKLRQRNVHLLERYIPSTDVQAVLAALSLGWKNDLNLDLRQSFSKAGTLHVLAVSGLHVGLIYFILQQLFRVLSSRWKPGLLKRSCGVMISCSGVWLFALMSGAAPSSMRAALLFSLMGLGTLGFRQSAGRNAWAGSACLLLLLKPWLLGSIGFQLSYAAVAGILWTYPSFRKRLPWNGWLGSRLADLIALSLAAQLGSLAPSWHYFGQFPLYFLLGNLVGVPWVGLLLCSCALLYLPFPPLLLKGLGYALSQLSSVWIMSMDRVGELPFCVLQLPPMPTLSALLFFGTVMLAFFSSHPKNQMRLRWLSLALLFFSFTWTSREMVISETQAKLMMECRSAECRTELNIGNRSIPIMGYAEEEPNSERIGHPLRGLLPLVIDDQLLYCYEGGTEFPYSNAFVLVYQAEPPFVSAEMAGISLPGSGDYLNPTTVLLMPDMNARTRQAWLRWCRERALKVEILPYSGTREFPLGSTVKRRNPLYKTILYNKICHCMTLKDSLCMARFLVNGC